MAMSKYTIFCTEEQTKKALEHGAPLLRLHGAGCSDFLKMIIISDTEVYVAPTAEEMIGFILESGKGYSTDLSELIHEQGYKQGCLTFIDNCLK